MRLPTSILIACMTFTLPLLSFAEEKEELKVGDSVEDVGTFVDLPDGNRLQLLIEDKQIVCHFVDAEGKLIAVPAESILFEVNDPGHKEDEWRAVLSPVDDITMTTPRRFYGPNPFRARIIIRYPDSDPFSFSKLAIDLERNQ